jgi:hypothetical protein
VSGDINEIKLVFHDPDEGWGHCLLLGTDMDRGWTIECDMENGRFISALTPAGYDPIFLMQIEPTSNITYAGTVVRIQVEAGIAEWDAVKRELTIRTDYGE